MKSTEATYHGDHKAMVLRALNDTRRKTNKLKAQLSLFLQRKPLTRQADPATMHEDVGGEGEGEGEEEEGEG